MTKNTRCNRCAETKSHARESQAGKRFRIHESPGKPRPLYEIVGVTADNKFQDMHEKFLPFMYFPSTQEEKPSPDDHILIRSSLPLTSLIASMKETIANANSAIDLEFLVFKTHSRLAASG